MKIFDIIKAAGYSVDGIAISDDGTVTFSPDYPADPAAVRALVTAQWDAAKLGDAVAAKTNELRAACDAAFAPYAKEYGLVEMVSWETQLREANAWTADHEAVTPWIDAACAARGMSKADFVARVLAKPAPWAAISGAIVGKRLALQDQVEAIAAGDGTDAEKIAAIEAVRWLG